MLAATSGRHLISPEEVHTIHLVWASDAMTAEERDGQLRSSPAVRVVVPDGEGSDTNSGVPGGDGFAGLHPIALRRLP